jgi:hypothetical protein
VARGQEAPHPDHWQKKKLDSHTQWRPTTSSKNSTQGRCNCGKKIGGIMLVWQAAFSSQVEADEYASRIIDGGVVQWNPKGRVWNVFAVLRCDASGISEEVLSSLEH